MLQDAKGLHGSTIHALDGEIGRVDEILFDDSHWTIRYLIVDTGSWLFGRKVLISPLAFSNMDWERHAVDLRLTRAQIENSPGVETDKPVSRQWETGYYDYFSWPYYWDGMGAWGAYWYPGDMYGNAETPREIADDRAHIHADAHLRSTKEVTGYGVSATNGHIGHVEDFIIDDETWRVCYLAVDTRDWWPGKKVLLPPDWIGNVNWPARSVTVNVTREQVRSGPEWDNCLPITSTFEDRLYGYYARQRPMDRERSASRMIVRSVPEALLTK